MRFPRLVAAAWLMLMFALAQAHAEKRVALVVGNDRYANLPAHEQLRNAVNDSRTVGRALRQIGFDVIAGENLGRSAMVDRFGDLMQRLAPGDTAFFFFSGHGVALDGVNYILPADVPDIGTGQESRLKLAALGETDIISELSGRGVRVAVVVLDACRTNPYTRSGSRGVGGAKGLAPAPQVHGVFSLYAASAGQSARDQLYDGDPVQNSVFSRVLAPMLQKQGLDLRDLAVEVREEVARLAQNAGYEQWPAYYDGTIGGRVYLAGLPPANSGTERPAGRNNVTFFVTSAGSGKGGDLGGLAGADAHCQKLAEAAGATGKTWHAYLSSNTPNDGKPAINARDRIGKGPWQNAKGAVVAKDVDDLHKNPNINKETLLDEKGERIKVRGDTPNMHDMLTGSDMEGRAFPGNMNLTCNNWSSSDKGSAMLGHGDRAGIADTVYQHSPFAAHMSRGCSQPDLVATGGNGLFYCFAAQ